MKKFLLVFVFVLMFPVFVHSQMGVVDVAMALLVEKSFAADVIHYGIVAADAATKIQNLVSMGKTMGDQLSLAVHNLNTLNSIESWSDFTNWYNRQLYMERRAFETFKKMNINVGGKSYHFTDVEGIGESFNEVLLKFQWDKEFSEEQRREMWIRLGLSPSNYVYRQVYKQKFSELNDLFFAVPDIINDDNMDSNNKLYDIYEELANDAKKPEDKRLGQKQLEMYQLEVAIETTKALNDIKMLMGEMMRMEAIKNRLHETPYSDPPLADWPEKGFEMPL